MGAVRALLGVTEGIFRNVGAIEEGTPGAIDGETLGLIDGAPSLLLWWPSQELEEVLKSKDGSSSSNVVGVRVVVTVGLTEGIGKEGATLGLTEGDILGFIDGDKRGALVGTIGAILGLKDGSALGSLVGVIGAKEG